MSWSIPQPLSAFYSETGQSDEILAWHHTDRASNGRIEGTNNLLQVLRRTAHGFTNPTNFEARGLLIT